MGYNWNTDYCTVTLQIALKGNGFAIRGNVSTEMGTFVDSVGYQYFNSNH